ncbi:uncharacterized protein [Montipora capricornis]|uniref:uncharacterized protein n=1 Tax=Montipora capricornis TaxID=246305 RepID=UPI0035F1AAE7
MDPSWPYASSRAFNMPFRAINPDPRISLGHQEVNYSQPTLGSLYPFDFACSTSSPQLSPSPSSLGEADQHDSQSPSQSSQSTTKKYDKWTNEQQRYLVQLWADWQDMINSKDSRNAWRDIAEAINNKFKTNKTVDKCLRKIKYLINAYKEKKEWNRNQTGGNLRKSIFYDEIDAVLGCRDAVTLKHVQEGGDSSSPTSSADSDSPSNLSSESSREEALDPKETAAPPKSRLERKKGQGKRKRKVNDAEDGDGDEHFRQAFDEIKAQGQRVASSMEKMQEMQMRQIDCMNQFMGDFLKAFKDK